ncbi:rhodanese-like domain-containing protein [Mycoplasmatota bacterium zrk1]
MYFIPGVILLFVFIIIKVSRKSGNGVSHLNSDDFNKDMRNGIILDVRSKREYKMGHINNSICIPINTLPDNLSKLDSSKPIYVYCASGARSSNAASYLLNKKYEVFNLRGGLNRWNGSITKK